MGPERRIWPRNLLGLLQDSAFCMFTVASKVVLFWFFVLSCFSGFQTPLLPLWLCRVSMCISVAMQPLLQQLMVDQVISGHEMLCVSDNIFW